MRGLAAAALALAIALPACAQRGGGVGHAGFAAHSASAAHSAPAFRSSFAPPASFRSSAAPGARAPMIYAPQRMTAPGVRYPASAPAIRPTFYHHGGTGFRAYPYPLYGYYPGSIYLPYGGFYDDWDDDYNPNETAPQPDSNYAYPQPDYSYQPQYSDAAPPPPAYPAYPQPAPEAPYIYPEAAPGYPGYQGYPSYAHPAPSAPQMQYVPGSSDTVTLIYKDGRPPEQIQNYLATRTTLTILDGGRRRIVPLSDLDLPATISANRQTGVDFQLPTATR